MIWSGNYLKLTVVLCMKDTPGQVTNHALSDHLNAIFIILTLRQRRSLVVTRHRGLVLARFSGTLLNRMYNIDGRLILTAEVARNKQQPLFS